MVDGLFFVVTTVQGEAHIVTADKSIVTVNAFVEEYITELEHLGFGIALSHPDLFVPFESIDSIVVKGAC